MTKAKRLPKTDGAQEPGRAVRIVLSLLAGLVLAFIIGITIYNDHRMSSVVIETKRAYGQVFGGLPFAVDLAHRSLTQSEIQRDMSYKDGSRASLTDLRTTEPNARCYDTMCIASIDNNSQLPSAVKLYEDNAESVMAKLKADGWKPTPYSSTQGRFIEPTAAVGGAASTAPSSTASGIRYDYQKGATKDIYCFANFSVVTTVRNSIPPEATYLSLHGVSCNFTKNHIVF